MRRSHSFLFALLLVLLPVQLGYHFWPEWTMVLGRRVDYLSPTIYLTDILIFLLLISWLKEHPPKLSKVTLKWIIFVMLIAVVNIVFGTSSWESLYKWGKVAEYFLLGAYIVYIKPKLSDVIFYLSIGVLYSSIIAVAQYLLQQSIGLWILGERTFSSMTPGIAQFNVCRPFSNVCTLVMRSYATFPHPNVLGGFLAILVPLMIMELTSKQGITKFRKYIFAVAVILGIGALVLTFSRSAWAVGVLGMGGIYATQKSMKKYLLPFLLGTLVVLVVISTSIGLQDESVVVRSQLNFAAIAQFFRSPLIGVGLGNFLIELPKTLVSRQIYFLQPVHNIYLLILAETGVLGVGLFLWFVWMALRNKAMIQVSLISFLLLGFVDHYPATLQQGQLLLTILLSLSLASTDRPIGSRT